MSIRAESSTQALTFYLATPVQTEALRLARHIHHFLTKRRRQACGLPVVYLSTHLHPSAGGRALWRYARDTDGIHHM